MLENEQWIYIEIKMFPEFKYLLSRNIAWKGAINSNQCKMLTEFKWLFNKNVTWKRKIVLNRDYNVRWVKIFVE